MTDAHLKIPYRNITEYQPVDIAKLRPAGSYKKLIENRSHPIENLIAQHGHIPAEFLKDRPCPTCGSTAYALELEKDHMRLVRCSECSLVFVNPVFDEDHYLSIYNSASYQEIVRELGEESHQYRVNRFGKERVEIMTRFLAGVESPSYLDVGCSTGFVVEAAQNAGWDAQGIDLNSSAINFGKSRDLRLSVANIFDLTLPEASLDAISLFDVLEHVVDPRSVLKKAISLLKVGGIVFLYVPNYDSASRVLMGKDAHFIWPTHHLTYYSPRTIADLANRLDLSVEMITTEGLDIADYIWYQSEVQNRSTDALAEIGDSLQFFINAGGYGKNLRLLARKVR